MIDVYRLEELAVSVKVFTASDGYTVVRIDRDLVPMDLRIALADFPLYDSSRPDDWSL